MPRRPRIGITGTRPEGAVAPVLWGGGPVEGGERVGVHGARPRGGGGWGMPQRVTP